MPKKQKETQTDLNAIVQQAVLSAMARNEAMVTDAVQAAKTNQKYGFSVILGESHHGGCHAISERILRSSESLKKYRLKVVQYRYFSTQEKLDEYCEKHYITMLKFNDTQTDLPDDEELLFIDD